MPVSNAAQSCSSQTVFACPDEGLGRTRKGYILQKASSRPIGLASATSSQSPHAQIARYNPPMGILQNIPECVTGDNKASAYATMSFLGISCLHAWIFGINTSGESASPSIAWQWTYVALAAFMLLASTAMPKGAECLSRKLDSAAALIGAASTIALALVAVFGASEILQITGIVGVGASLGWMYLRWGQFYAKLDIRNAACALFLSGAVGSCIKSALFVASVPLMWIALAALPIASAILCSSANRTLERQEPAEPTRMYFESHSLSAFAKVFVIFVVFSLANGFILAIQSGSPSQAGTAPFMIARAAEIALCTAVLVYAFKFNKAFDFAQLWRVILVILSSAILLPSSCLKPVFRKLFLRFR